MPSPVITITFKLQDLAGGAAAANIVVTLLGYGSVIPKIGGTSIISDTQITPAVAADGTGSFTPWGNDVIAPGPNITYYMVQVRNAQGGTLQANLYQFTGSGTSDLSSLSPINVTAPFPPPAPANAVLTNPSGPQSIATFPLTTGLSSCIVVNFLSYNGATSGATILQASAIASGTLTLPAGTDTLVGKATTDTLTNKTLTSPILVTPNIGVATGTSLNLSGNLIAAGAGIGTSSPGATLHVTTTSTNVARGIISEQTSNDANGSFVYLQKSRAGGTVINGDPVGSFSAIANDGTQLTSSARVKFTVDGAVSAGVVPISIGFFTGTGGSGTERLHISSAGVITVPGVLSVSSILNGAGTVTFPSSTDTLVARATTDTLQNKVLAGAASGNNVNLLNSQDALANLTGTGADQTVYTFTIPANTVQAGKGIKLKFWAVNNNAVALTYKVILGSTTLFAPPTTATSGDVHYINVEIFNNAGVQNAQVATFQGVDAITNFTTGVTTSAENFANALVLKVTAAQANPNTIAPKKFYIELVQ